LAQVIDGPQSVFGLVAAQLNRTRVVEALDSRVNPPWADGTPCAQPTCIALMKTITITVFSCT
jgi:hypothetical protein